MNCNVNAACLVDASLFTEPTDLPHVYESIEHLQHYFEILTSELETEFYPPAEVSQFISHYLYFST